MSNLKVPYFQRKNENEKIFKEEEIKDNNNQVLKTIGNNIRTFRKFNKLTIAELAEKAKLSSVYIFSIEKNYQNISVTHLKDIAEVFGVKMYILLLEESYIHEILEIYEKLKKYSCEELITIEKLIEGKIKDKNYL